MKLLVFIIIKLTGVIIVISNPIVHIKNGTLEGIFMQSRNGRKFSAFMGIPYALPPLGDLRFEPPTPALSWTKILSAKNHSEKCTQRDIFIDQKEIIGGEDCLYLNVYTPHTKIPEKSKIFKKYPVIVAIHGGGFFTGSGNSDIFGPQFLLDHEVILVTFNYRLGPLGFLSTGDSVILGNQGLKDQAQAIRWVNENISEFGGDKNKITLLGHSAGGASVHYHMLSPLSKGLFQRAISQSGSALCPWAFKTREKAKLNAQKLGKFLKCPISSSTQLLHCLKQKSNTDIIAVDDKFKIFDYCPMGPFGPVSEPDHHGAFLNENPSILLRKGKITDVPWMTGANSQEGAIKVSRIHSINNGKLIEELDENFETIAPVTLLYEDKYPQRMLKNITKSIREFYFGDQPLNKFITTSLTDGSMSFCDVYNKKTDYGVCHGDELQYLFPIKENLFPDVPINNEENKMIDLMTNLWFNFADSGNPNYKIRSDLFTVNWEPIRTNSFEYLHIKNLTEIFMDQNYCPKRIRFGETLPSFIEDSTLSQNAKDEL